MSFTRADVRDLREELEAHLATFAKEKGMAIKVGSARFLDNNITYKMEVSGQNDQGEIVSKEVEDFGRYCIRYGLKPDDLNKTFVSRGEEFQITGLKPRNHKYPILATRLKDGKQYKFPAEDVRVNVHKD
jgi:hypothetical protein